jgi:hypothetical protein
LDEEDLDFSAESIGDYVFDELRLVGRTFKNIEFASGDNCSTNHKIMTLISRKVGYTCPLIGIECVKLRLLVTDSTKSENR